MDSRMDSALPGASRSPDPPAGKPGISLPAFGMGQEASHGPSFPNSRFTQAPVLPPQVVFLSWRIPEWEIPE